MHICYNIDIVSHRERRNGRVLKTARENVH